MRCLGGARGQHPCKMLDEHVPAVILVPLCMTGGAHHGDLGNLVDLRLSATLVPQAQALHRLGHASVRASGGAIGASTAGHSQSRRLSCPRTAQSVLCLQPNVLQTHSIPEATAGCHTLRIKVPAYLAVRSQMRHGRARPAGGESFPIIFMPHCVATVKAKTHPRP